MNSIVAYFSHRGYNYIDGKIKYLEKGNTEILAHMIACFNQLPLFKIETLNEYPDDFYQYIDITQQELCRKVYPELKHRLDKHYSVIYLGYPNYWGTMPRAVFTFLRDLDDTNVIIYPFITHDGGGVGDSIEDIKKLCPNAIIKPPLALRGNDIRCQLFKVERWIRKGSHDLW